MDLIGASELLISWPMTRIRRCHACRSSSRSDRLTSVRTSSSSGQPALPEALVRASPSGRIRRGTSPQSWGSHRREACRQAERVGVAVQAALWRPREQSLAGAVHEPELPLRIEGEHGHRDLLHHGAEQARRVERAQPLLAQRVGERVDLDQHLAERIVAPRAPRADREVLLAQRREEVRQRLEREDDALAQCQRPADSQRPTTMQRERSTRASAGRGRSRGVRA